MVVIGAAQRPQATPNPLAPGMTEISRRGAQAHVPGRVVVPNPNFTKFTVICLTATCLVVLFSKKIRPRLDPTTSCLGWARFFFEPIGAGQPTTIFRWNIIHHLRLDLLYTICYGSLCTKKHGLTVK